MKAFIITMLAIRGLDVLMRLVFLADNNYPRRNETQAHIDVIILIISLCLFIWGWSTIK